MKPTADMSLYSRETYIAAYRWFGWTLEKAESLYDGGKRDDNLVQEYLRHMNQHENENVEEEVGRIIRDVLVRAGYVELTDEEYALVKACFNTEDE